MTHAIALIDGNNFYASCEQSLDPSLLGCPLVVLSNNDGCIIARSVEARNLGITMGQPFFKAKQKLKAQGVIIRSSNYALYGDMSRRLMRLLESYCEQLEPYSIDEAFASISYSINQDLNTWARKLRTVIRQQLGLPISIGIGASKVQAKIANHLAKRMSNNAGIFDLTTTQDLDIWLATINVENIWGIGRKLAHRFRLEGVNTALQLREMPSNKLRLKFGVVGMRLQYELRGQTCLHLRMVSTPKQETCVSRSFSRPITSLEELRQAIATHAIRASEKLRQQKQLAGAITVFTRTSPFASPFYNKSMAIKLDMPSNDTKVILEACLKLTEKIFQPYRLLIKAGVVMQDLQSTDYIQQHLLINRSYKEQNREQLMSTIDNLNYRYGNGTIGWAICSKPQSWAMSRERLSNAATTRIPEVPTVKV